MMAACVIPAQARDDGQDYEMALNNLKRYLIGDSRAPALEAISRKFVAIESYMLSHSFGYYVDVLEAVETDQYRRVDVLFNRMRANLDFCHYVQTEPGFISVDELYSYTMGCKAEYENDPVTALMYFYPCAAFTYSLERIADLEDNVMDAWYREAEAHCAGGTYDGYLKALELYEKLAQVNYLDSAEQAIRARAAAEAAKPTAMPRPTATPAPKPTATPAPKVKLTVEKMDVKSENYTITTYSNGTCCITEYTGEAANLIIPEYIDGYSVTAIGDDAFYNCEFLTSITISNNVTTIGNWGFWNCSSLTTMTIPDGIKSIGKYAFDRCFSLTSITIPDSVTSIGKYAFDSCSQLKLHVKANSYAHEYAKSNNIPYTTYYPPSAPGSMPRAVFCCHFAPFMSVKNP